MNTNCLSSLLLLTAFVFHSWTSNAQNTRITGLVTDGMGIPLPSATISIDKLNRSTTTDEQGNFYFGNILPGQYEIRVEHVGYASYTRWINATGNTNVKVEMIASGDDLQQVVVVGYGKQKKQDLTGSVALIEAKDFNKGVVGSPDQLIAGKVPGVQVTSNGGAPGSGGRIRIRGGSSLNANNDPLIVLDGIPLDFNQISGAPNPLSLVNPNDIESFTVLKDASATAIYGSRAANGVILIATKKGNSKKQVSMAISSLNAYAHNTKKIDVLSADEFRKIIAKIGSAAQQELVGEAATDWQSEIFRNAFTTDNNFSFGGGITGLPYRVSIGWLSQQGTIKTSSLSRKSGTINLNPTFFSDHLKVNFYFKAAENRNWIADEGAIGTAVSFDPTQPVRENNKFGGFFEWTDDAGNLITQASRNPLGLLELRKQTGDVSRILGSTQLDYRLHFFPDMSINLNYGFDRSESVVNDVIDPRAGVQFNNKGSIRKIKQEKFNSVFDLFLNYSKQIRTSSLEGVIGYSHQSFIRDEPASQIIYGTGTPVNIAPFRTENTLLGAFARLNYSLDKKYLLTVNLRRDGSSRFKPGKKWGTFPSAAVGWRLKDENFLRGVTAISELKVRVGYGIVGQQDIIGNDYPYLARYTLSESTAQYQLGNTFYSTLRAEGYDENIKWEQTSNLNLGVDFGFFDNRITGSLDFYQKKTKDLLSVIPIAAGSNLTNRILTNVGNVENRGVEVALHANRIELGKLQWNASFNVTYNTSRITNLSKVKNSDTPGILTGDIAGLSGNTIQIHSVGYRPNSFYVLKQIYDDAKNPIEGVYEDRNGDGQVNDKDYFVYQHPDPTYFLGFSSSISFARWSLSWLLRANLGNYVYNNVFSNNASYRALINTNYLNNVHSGLLKTNFDSYQLKSDYFIENASFARLEHLTIGYDLKIFRKKQSSLGISATVQNLVTLSRYTGIDPEIPSGIDNNFYPRPRTYLLALNFNF